MWQRWSARRGGGGSAKRHTWVPGMRGGSLCNLKLRVKLEECECAVHAAGIEDREAHLQRWALVRPRDGDRTPVFLFCWVRGTGSIAPSAQGCIAEVTTMVNHSFRPRTRPPPCAVGCGGRKRYLHPLRAVTRRSPRWSTSHSGREHARLPVPLGAGNGNAIFLPTWAVSRVSPSW